MKILDRKDFLLNHWPKYPPLPEGEGWICGALSDLARQGHLLFTSSLNFHGRSWTSKALLQILVMEDKVALKKADSGRIEEIRLLSPALSSSRSGKKRVRLFQDFVRFLSEIRKYFEGLGFLEAPTPTLVPCPGMEAHLEPFEVSLGEGKSAFLPTSPEIHLKKLLCEGFERIFEIKSCFRNDPPSPIHRKEFFLLEWYRAYEPLKALKSDIEGLLKHLAARGLWQKSVEIRVVTFRELFSTHFQFELRADTSKEELLEIFKKFDIHFHESDSKVDLIHRLLLEKVEPEWEGLTLLHEFPPEMAVLSRLKENGFAERFELYFDQVELANAFFEVNDPKLQRERWEQDVKERRELGLKELAYDEELIRMMETWGMPPASGIALGLDRLFMVGQNLSDLFFHERSQHP